MKTNKAVSGSFRVFTHEGAPAVSHESIETKFHRSLMCCLLWEDSFYESGESIAERLYSYLPHLSTEFLVSSIIQARTSGNLRHAPLFLTVSMLDFPMHAKAVERLLPQVVKRADEIPEALSMYWKKGKKPIPHVFMRALARCFTQFNEYQFAKYDRPTQIKLKDVLKLSHPKPENEVQSALYKKILDGTLETPDTWEVALSTGQDKKSTWERLILENKLGGLAFLRNLRNMINSSVDRDKIISGFKKINFSKVLPYRFIAAAKHAPSLELFLEDAMFRGVKDLPKLKGTTLVLVDVSWSMQDALSAKSDLNRLDAACGLSILCRELCEDARIYTFSNYTVEIPARRGFALRDLIPKSQPNRGTLLGATLSSIKGMSFDRLIVLTDEQSQDVLPSMKDVKAKMYMINVASYANSVARNSEWIKIAGWSENVIQYIQASENFDE